MPVSRFTSLQLLPYETNKTLNQKNGREGELFYNTTTDSLRIYDGKTKGGFELLRADLANLTGNFGVTLSDTPPAAASSGQQWINSNTGVLYVYYVDNNGGHWIQPYTSPIGSVATTPGFPVATYTTPGLVQLDGSTINVDPTGTITAVINNVFNNSNFVGFTTSYTPANVLNTVNAAVGLQTLDFAQSGNVFYFINPVGPFSANFINVPTTANRSTTITLAIKQNAIPYLLTTVQINGVAKTISWSGGVAPSGTANNYDIITLVLLNINGTFYVNGSLTTFR